LCCLSTSRLFSNEEDETWELVSPDDGNPIILWKTKTDALKDFARDGRKIEDPFRMRPQEERPASN